MEWLWLLLGRWLESRGLASSAETCYRQAGQRGSDDAWFRLGRSLLDRYRPEDARAALLQAVALAPGHARAWNSLGAAQRLCADLPAARRSYERALALEPGLLPAINNLGEALLIQGEAESALANFERVLAAEPGFYQALVNRVAALLELGRGADAEVAAEAAIGRYPDRAPLEVNLGNVLLHSGRARQAVGHYRRALELDPGCEEAHHNMAMWSGDADHMVQAIDYLRREIAMKGESATRLSALALAQQTKGDVAGAEASCCRALELQPGHMSALMTLAGCLSARGEHRQANELHERVLAINPKLSSVASNTLFNLTYLPDETSETVFEAHRAWARRFEAPLAESRFRHPPTDDPDRRLRIGYVSGDFLAHPVGFLLRDVLAHHDGECFEIHCYSMVRREDEITVTIRGEADHWHDEAVTDDRTLAEKIHEDGIDILVDLSGHTAYHRLLVFARRPAPVQATWIGYFHSTGLEGIDYFITDPHTSPRGCGQRFSETPLHLPHSRFCYSPPDYAPPVASGPAAVGAVITFGSFNRAEKLMPPTIDAWAAILLQVPESRLLLKARAYDDAATRDKVTECFVAAGVAAERLVFRGISSHGQMLAEYGDLDIALDPFPFNGGMTTLEALWMGVPVVALAGEGVVSRQSLALLANIGLAELAFPSVPAYVAGAVALASDAETRARLRRELRFRLAASPVCQPAVFTRDLEDLFRRMWRARCAGERLPSDIDG